MRATGTDPGSGLGELEQLTATDPLDEPLWVHYVRALHRAGRQTEALRAAATARGALAEVGLEPGAALRARPRARRRPGAVTAGHSPDGWHRPTVAPAAVDGPRRVRGRRARAHRLHPALQRRPRLVVLNPAMLTIDGLLDDPHPGPR